MSRQRALTLCLILVCIGLCAWIATRFEYYEETEDRGPDSIVYRNPFLAAGTFLQAAGVPSRVTNDFKLLENLPDQNAVLYLGIDAEILNQRQVETLIQWVGLGGRLIVPGPEDRTQADNLLFDRFGLSYTQTKCFCLDWRAQLSELLVETLGETIGEHVAEDFVDVSEDSAREMIERTSQQLGTDEQTSQALADLISQQAATSDQLTQIALPYLEPITANLDANYAFLINTGSNAVVSKLRPSHQFGSEYGTHFLAYSLGHGSVYFVSDREIWSNGHIDQQDHAFLLWQLARGASSVVFFNQATMPPLLELLVDYAPELLVCLALLLALWLYRRAYRIGVALPLTTDIHRSIRERYEAHGDYWWRHNPASLVQRLRADLTTLAQRRLNIDSNISAQLLAHQVAHEKQLNPDLTHLAFNASVPDTHAGFVAFMRAYQTVRRQLC